MPLITDVKQICDRLAGAGWRALMLQQGIDIQQPSAQALADALDKPVAVDRRIPGFEDFIDDTARGIEPGQPAASLLYHAFASPNVVAVPEAGTLLGALSQPIAQFPTLEELDAIANYIYARANRSLQDVRQRAADLLNVDPGAVELVTAVFATEYRPAPETPHQRHADLCHSRTGVARVGTTRAVYDGLLRGYRPFQAGDGDNTIRVLPCHYTTWLAVRSRRNDGRFGPARGQAADNARNFWVPVHKLFDGDECLRGETLRVSLEAHHQNKKLERLHRHLDTLGASSGFSDAERQQAPFILEQGLANWDGRFQGGAGLLSPQPQPLVARASFEGQPLTFPAPPMDSNGFSDAFSPTLSLNAPNPPVRPWPEYAHVRFEVEGTNVTYFGDRLNAAAKAEAGRYRALNVLDFTADGRVTADVAGLALDAIPAYSLIAAPDFFPSVDQREVFEWWQSVRQQGQQGSLPAWLQQLVLEGYWDFWRAQPVPLSDERSAPNITLAGSGFLGDDDTVTAIVTGLQPIDLQRPRPAGPTTRRHAALPDAAAGVFAPGWDTSGDRVPGPGNRTHLSTYGLGSPFPEDAKLCAALSTFWPAVAPDTERTFFQVDFASGTVCPLTDEENGAAAGSVSWDGLRGPRIVAEDSRRAVVRYPTYEHADYTLNALEGRFSIAATRNINFREYTGRILATLRLYRVFGLGGRNQPPKDSLRILSFRKVESTDGLLQAAQDNTGTSLSGPVYRFEVFDGSAARRVRSGVVGEEDFAVEILYTLFIGTSDFLLAMARRGDGSEARSRWQVIGG
ncbi:MAG: hypothetical protein ACFB5Z_19300 [Elainellaceae cyanobacterium]